jgi:tetratricopeptide (TPR) repeat protein/serine phosphatase RsbU (regulator of sigma subunit)
MLLLFNTSFAQQKVIDSLNNIINNHANHDTTIARAYCELSNILPEDTILYFCEKSIAIVEKALNNKPTDKERYSYLKTLSDALNNIGYSYKFQGDIPTALDYYNKSIEVSKSIDNKKSIAFSLNNIGVIYDIQGDITKSLKYYTDALNMNKNINYKSGIATNLNNIAEVYARQGDIPKALKYYGKSLKIFEEIDDKRWIAILLNNIGAIYRDQDNELKALDYYNRALKISEETYDKQNTAYYLLNIGSIYQRQKNTKKALEYNDKALKINRELNNKYGISISLGNMGSVYYGEGNLTKALDYYQKSIAISREIGDKQGETYMLEAIAEILLQKGDLKAALKTAQQSLKLAKELAYPEDIDRAAHILSQIYEKLNSNKQALEMFKLHITMRDSIINIKNQKATIRQQLRYDYEKQSALDSIANAKEMEIKNAQLEKINIEKEAQRKQRNFLLLGLALVLLFVLFIVRSYIQKNKANILLAEQKQAITMANTELSLQNEEIRAQRDEIEKQKEIVEEIHFQVSQSINYAIRIQQAILPEEHILEKYFSEHFVLFKPKDKVSGDFYWWSHVGNHTIITAADCTGHGVPGAFMSMLGTSFLREIVQKENITHTGVILRKLREEIIKALKQKGESGEQKDGMDMAIVSINHNTNTIQFSGANNPLYILSNRSINNLEPLKGFENFYEIKPDKMPIAIYEKMGDFTTHEIQLEKGDQLYMFSDGFADQFGGPKGKKFKYKPFKRLFSENIDRPMKEQEELLNKAFETWKGDLEQIDDVVVLGIKI